MTCTGTPLRRCGQIIPTGREDEIRDKMEQWAGALFEHIRRWRWPGRSGSRRASTSWRRTASQSATRRLTVKSRSSSRGADAATSAQAGEGIRRELKVEVNHHEMIVTDLGVGVVLVTVEGGGAENRPWTQIYVVFRGSRGEGPETNPNMAGWARFNESLHAAELHNIDWRVELPEPSGRPDVGPRRQGPPGLLRAVFRMHEEGGSASATLTRGTLRGRTCLRR